LPAITFESGSPESSGVTCGCNVPFVIQIRLFGLRKTDLNGKLVQFASCLLSCLLSEFRLFGIPRRGDEGEYAYAVQRDIARHAASLASGEEPSKFSEIHYDAKSTFRQCSEISGDFEELHSDLL